MEGTKKIKSTSFHLYSWNSEVETNWISLISWHHKTSNIHQWCFIHPAFLAFNQDNACTMSLLHTNLLSYGLTCYKYYKVFGIVQKPLFRNENKFLPEKQYWFLQRKMNYLREFLQRSNEQFFMICLMFTSMISTCINLRTISAILAKYLKVS